MDLIETAERRLIGEDNNMGAGITHFFGRIRKEYLVMQNLARESIPERARFSLYIDKKWVPFATAEKISKRKYNAKVEILPYMIYEAIEAMASYKLTTPTMLNSKRCLGEIKSIEKELQKLWIENFRKNETKYRR